MIHDRNGMLFVKNDAGLPGEARLVVPAGQDLFGDREGVLDGDEADLAGAERVAVLLVDAGIVVAVADVQLLDIRGLVDPVVAGNEKPVLEIGLSAGVFGDKQQVPELGLEESVPDFAFPASVQAERPCFVVRLWKDLRRQLLGHLPDRQFRNRV